MDISLELKTNISGDFDLLNDNDTLLQDETIIIESNKGNIINNVLLGVGITKYLSGPINILDIKYAIKSELQKDGIIVTNTQIINGEINIDATKKIQ